ncbi:nucleoside diphosphate-linked moiety x motif 18 [Lasius niger]|uniref:Nucleoside diphosphate-linked moiety x motif 18 n=1 Tax=Lasius niger TaxID=67767 RepID=A0A0J7MRX0_LASNI|nr:nucleoside diphosphate-linked moiety x motif 18 [Lasius niger]
MSDFIENQVQLLLAGQALENDDICNVHTLASDTIGAKSGQLTGHVPICLKTVTYIVAAVVINDQGEVLMMQEAKASCSGKWYLPAGRVEKNENLISAVKREVLEETGLVIAPTSLILVECANDRGRSYVSNKSTSQHPYLMPMTKPHTKLLLRLVVTSKKRAT